MGCRSAEGIKYGQIFMPVAKKTQVANFYVMNFASMALPHGPALSTVPPECCWAGRDHCGPMWEKLESRLMECAALLIVLLIFKMWI